MWTVVRSVEFRVDRTGGEPALVPFIDGMSLKDLVELYEAAHCYDPAGDYDGLVPGHFNFGDPRRYYLGRDAKHWPGHGHAWLLGCSCGEAGCWPLSARISVTDALMTWSDFGQPHRPEWDYADFGPFEFDRREYEDAARSGSSASTGRQRKAGRPLEAADHPR